MVEPMSLSTALSNLASALDSTLFELTPANETQQTYSWMTDEELLRHLSTDNTPLIIELRERLERTSEELITSEILVIDLEKERDEKVAEYEQLNRKCDDFLDKTYNTLFTLSDAVKDLGDFPGHTEIDDISEKLESLGKEAYDLI